MNVMEKIITKKHPSFLVPKTLQMTSPCPRIPSFQSVVQCEVATQNEPDHIQASAREKISPTLMQISHKTLCMYARTLKTMFIQSHVLFDLDI